MKKQSVKISIEVSKDEIDALIGNFGVFSKCAGFDQELIKVNQRDYEKGTKFYFSEGVALQVNDALKILLNGPKYKNKSGKEYHSILLFMENMSREYNRQKGNKINT